MLKHKRSTKCYNSLVCVERSASELRALLARRSRLQERVVPLPHMSLGRGPAYPRVSELSCLDA